MLYYIAYCLYIFFIVLQIDVLLYLLKNILPGAGWFKYFVDMLAAPALSPVQKYFAEGGAEDGFNKGRTDYIPPFI